MEILRHDRVEFAGSVELKELKRDPKTLVEYLLRDKQLSFGRVSDDGNRYRAAQYIHAGERRPHSHHDRADRNAGE